MKTTAVIKKVSKTTKKKQAKSTRKNAPQPLVSRSPATKPHLSIVGIGASAGGLEALEQFLRHVPEKSGLAFVVIQHMKPNGKSMLVEILQRTTSMPVEQIEDNTKVRPDHVYVTPPNSDVMMLHGILHIDTPAAADGLRLPIDSFFRSLAEDQKGHAIGVILSGMGFDGTQGLRAIKERAGVTFVQSPESAKFDGMPKSAIDSGTADVVLPAEQLADRILLYVRHSSPPISKNKTNLLDKDEKELAKIILILRSQSGHDFTYYKKNSIYRRIERRMNMQQLHEISDYVDYLKKTPGETELLFKDLLIGVTSFFRDPSVWEQLKNEILPKLLAIHPQGGQLRAWVPACSTGEEAYSLAISFQEVLSQLKTSQRYTLQIFATDLDLEFIKKARAGHYPASIAKDVGVQRLQKFFVPEGPGYRVNTSVREMVVFATHNLITDPPFTRLDILSCRNLLIYLNTNIQDKLISMFHYSLNPDGILLLGSSETVGHHKDLFTLLPGKNRFHRRNNSVSTNGFASFSSEFAQPHTQTLKDFQAPRLVPASTDLKALTDSLLLRSYTPAAVLVNEQGEIQFIKGKTGKYLEPASGKANLNIFAMARKGLRSALNEAFNKAVRLQRKVTIKDVKIAANGDQATVDISAQILNMTGDTAGLVLIVFEDSVAHTESLKTGPKSSLAASDARLIELQKQLNTSSERMKITREEMQTSLEELNSSNEELQSTNEELQSTNEELTTSKEEMQSMNEELQTVNHELQAKMDELSRVNDDMHNLFEYTDLATLYLDKKLNIRRFTSQTASIFKLRASDIGRPITDLSTHLEYPDLIKNCKQVLKSLDFQEEEVSTNDGRWFNVRIMPYRTQNNRVEGILLTFFDITETKDTEAHLRGMLISLQKRFDEQADALKKATELIAAADKKEKSLKGQHVSQDGESGLDNPPLSTGNSRNK